MTETAPLTGYPVIDEIVAVIGWDAMLKLVRKFGGQRIFITERPQPDDRLIAAVGEADAATLRAHFHRTEIAFPVEMRREIEFNELRRKHPDLTINDLAGQLMVSYRTVRRMGQRKPKAVPLADRDRKDDGRQGSLLDRFG